MEANKVLEIKMDTVEFINWVDCWFIIACLSGIPNQHLWYSSTDPNMFSGYPFQLNKYISRDHFNEIISTIQYNNEKVNYMDMFIKIQHF